MKNLELPPPQIEDGKMVRLGFRTASSLISGEGGLLLHFILSKIVVVYSMKTGSSCFVRVLF